ncbi:MAG: hypothetical protein ACRDY6_18980 [Acidimicrobiia bacterium]
MFTDARPIIEGTHANRPAMKELIQLLQSFEPADRARAGHELVTGGLSRSADPLLEHVANEFDDRVLTAIARAVVAVPPVPKESRRVQDLRAWADSELERLALEEAFLGREPEPVVVQSDAPAVAPPVAEPLAAESVAAPDPDTLELRVELQALATPPPPPIRHISWRPPGVAPVLRWQMPPTETTEDA